MTAAAGSAAASAAAAALLHQPASAAAARRPRALRGMLLRRRGLASAEGGSSGSGSSSGSGGGVQVTSRQARRQQWLKEKEAKAAEAPAAAAAGATTAAAGKEGAVAAAGAAAAATAQQQGGGGASTALKAVGGVMLAGGGFLVYKAAASDSTVDDTLRNTPGVGAAYGWVYDTVFKPFINPSREKLLPDWHSIPNIPPDAPCPPTLVLDLEDTLVHATWDPKYGWRYAKRPGAGVRACALGHRRGLSISVLHVCPPAYLRIQPPISPIPTATLTYIRRGPVPAGPEQVLRDRALLALQLRRGGPHHLDARQAGAHHAPVRFKNGWVVGVMPATTKAIDPIWSMPPERY